MLFPVKTTELMAKYGDKLIKGIITPDELESLHKEDYRMADAHPMDTMLDLVAATAPLMNIEILYNLTEKLFEAALKRDEGSNVFMRDPSIAKYYLAYLSCFYPERAKNFLSDQVISKAVIKPITGVRKFPDAIIILKFRNIMMESAKFSLLVHIAKDQATQLSNSKANVQIEQLRKSSIEAYIALNKSPDRVFQLHKLQEKLLSIIISLNSHDFRPITAESEQDSESPRVDRTSRKGMLAFFGFTRPHSAGVSQEEASDVTSKSPLIKRADSAMSDSPADVSSLSLRTDSSLSNAQDLTTSKQSLSQPGSRSSPFFSSQRSGTFQWFRRRPATLTPVTPLLENDTKSIPPFLITLV